MAGIEQHEASDSASSLIDQLHKAIHELEAFKDASENKVHWTEIKQYFCNLQVTLKKKSEELEAKEKEYVVKEAETLALIVEKETIVATKEQDYLDRVQELKDAAVATIAEARANFRSTAADSLDSGENEDTKVRSSVGDINSPDEEFPCKTSENTENIAANVKLRPELTKFCEQMDARGLRNFITENLKFLNDICRELPLALESASEPARLVLNSLEGFYPPDETTQTVDKTDASLQGMRKSCLVLLEAMAIFFSKTDPDDTHLLNPEIKLLAKAIADEWRPKLSNAGSGAAIDNSVEAEAFLQLLATFKIASEFEKEQLCKLVFVVAHSLQAPELCRSVGLTLKMPGLVELLINSGRQVDAVRFIHSFQLTERFPPVPLLKMFLKDLRRNSQGKGGGSHGADGSQDDINARELAALKAVVRCVQDYGLEADYSLDPLQKRLAQLEKAKADSKKRGEIQVNITHGRNQDPTVDFEDFGDLQVGKLHRFTTTGLHLQGCRKGILMLVQTPTVIKSRANRPMPIKPMMKDSTTILKMTKFRRRHTMQLHPTMEATVAADCNHQSSHLCSFVLLILQFTIDA
ncbi:putative Aspartic proteinase nepenthesin-1 precursor [Hibiscus syriacus]|uniref:FRIGIDA-like protein n=1 Tax=Hibiscus syriacus TaxID=106335 RepID=A0A6A3A853_HIBSY|nr:putative Aspartic proteinase nepenthesin-1 precursor [Hibiscus syriacus]